MKLSITKSWTVILTLLALAFSAIGVTPAYAATFTVTNLNDSGAGSLRQAIIDANAAAGADIITFSVSGTIPLASTLPTITAAGGALTMDGTGQTLTVSGNHAVRVALVTTGASLTLNNLTIANGSVDDGGGGSGIYNLGGTLTITNSTFYGNRAMNGGSGGAIINTGTLSITNSAFSGNSATGGGGSGGAIISAGTLTITNSTFSGNSAEWAGGGIYNWQGNTMTLRNSILANSPSGGNCSGGGTITNGGDNIDDGTTCGLGSVSGSMSSTNPLLGPLADNGGPTLTFALLAGSPAIDGVTFSAPNSAPATDQRGVARPQGVRYDIGAFESAVPAFIVNTSADTNDGSCDLLGQGIGNKDCTLREAINAANALAGDDTITFSVSGPIILTSTLPNITAAGGALTMDGTGQNLTISGNSLVQVALVDAGALLTLKHLTIANGNAGSDGGGINNSGTLTVTNSAFSGNSAGTHGGGINNSGTLTVTYTTFSGNSATSGFGGGIINGGTATITNSTFSGNSATGGLGGGINNGGGTLTITNSTFSGNSASTGGVIYNSGTVTLRNTIVANSTSGGNCFGTITNGGNNIDDNTSCGWGAVSGSMSSTNPLLGALANNGGPTQTMKLLPTSPAIDAGMNTDCPATDQRGVTRPQPVGGNCDIGAYENSAPTDINLSASSVIENLPAGTTVGTLTTTDLDAADTHTYSFTCSVPGADDASFQIGGAGNNELQTAAVFDFETKNNYAICIRTDDGNGTFDKAFTVFVTDGPNLELLTPLNGASLHYNRPIFDWSDFSSATGYQIQVSKNSTFTLLSTNNMISGAANSNYTPTSNLPANTLLYWRVRAKLGATNSAWSSVWTLHTGSPPSIPSLLAPANNALTRDLTPLLNWTQSTGANFDHYQIQLADNPDFTGAVDENIAGISNHSFTPTVDLIPNTKHYWHVRSWNTAGDYSAWSALRTFRESMVLPVLVDPIGGITVGSRKPVFDWNDVGATKYNLQVSLNSSFTSLVLNLNVTPSTYTPLVNLAANKLFRWRVRALGPNGPSAWSAVETFHTP